VKRVLIVTEAGDAWPSGRIRALIYKDRLMADGFEVRHITRRLPWVSRQLQYSGAALPNPRGRLNLAGWMKRVYRSLIVSPRELQIVRLAKGYDVIYLQKVESWPLVSALRRTTKARLVYDLNDGIWLPKWSSFAGGRIRDILQVVDAVTCDNPFGLEFARSCNPYVFLVPDPPQVELFDHYRPLVSQMNSSVVLGWVGSPGTLFNLYSIWEPLEKLFARFQNITLRLIGAGHNKSLLPPFEKVRYTTLPYYSQVEMVCEVLQMDVGLFPLFDIEDSHVRGILKATVYMSGETSVVTPPIGQNCELIMDGENGLFARNVDEWLEQLTRLTQDVDLRRRIAQGGLQTVRKKFTLSKCYKKLLDALRA